MHAQDAAAVSIAGAPEWGVGNVRLSFALIAKHLRSALDTFAQVPGQLAVFTTAGGADGQQLARHLAEVRLSIPQWRQQRPALMVQSAQYLPSVGSGTLLLRCASSQGCLLNLQAADMDRRDMTLFSDISALRLYSTYSRCIYAYVLNHRVTLFQHDPTSQGLADCSGYVRQRGLNVNGLLHIPGAGDFQMDRIDSLTGLQASQSSIIGGHHGAADGVMPQYQLAWRHTRHVRTAIAAVATCQLPNSLLCSRFKNCCEVHCAGLLMT
jgi:hypothetical protein